MSQRVSVREPRNSTAAVVAAVRAGERVTLTVNRDPVADIVPHVERRDPWVSSNVLREIVRDAPLDGGLLADLADVRGAFGAWADRDESGAAFVERVRSGSARRLRATG
jgi:antitoxin (DNA-binding transcriptional repressor) of toxin-antitoxin stability system